MPTVSEVEAALLNWYNSKRKRYGFEPLTTLSSEIVRAYGDDMRAALEAAAKVREHEAQRDYALRNPRGSERN